MPVSSHKCCTRCWYSLSANARGITLVSELSGFTIHQNNTGHKARSLFLNLRRLLSEIWWSKKYVTTNDNYLLYTWVNNNAVQFWYFFLFSFPCMFRFFNVLHSGRRLTPYFAKPSDRFVLNNIHVKDKVQQKIHSMLTLLKSWLLVHANTLHELDLLSLISELSSPYKHKVTKYIAILKFFFFAYCHP